MKWSWTSDHSNTFDPIGAEDFLATELETLTLIPQYLGRRPAMNIVLLLQLDDCYHTGPVAFS